MEDFEDDNDEQTEFYFESDHLALRGNADYCNVLRQITILQAQRTQATKELDQIVTAQRAALADPEEFMRKLVENVPVDVPGPIHIAEVPKINFAKYNVTIPTYLGPETQKPVATTAPKANDLTVRGRLFDQSKPESFNQLWSNAEQRRLEELLVEYPPEPIEMRRFAKIAKALGNRTTKQVASRLQKYFKKLHSAGFPIPGRLPKRARQAPNAQKLLKQAVKPSTFFPNQDVPVTMCEGSEDSLGNPLDPAFYQKYSSGDGGRSMNLRMEVVSRDQETDGQEALEAKILRLLKRIRADREIVDRPYSEHAGHKCDQCGEEPIVGTRWACTTCSTPVDFCMDCMITQIKDPTGGHPLDHKFVGVRCVPSDGQQPRTSDGSDEECDVEKSGSFHDKDYLAHRFNKNGKDYNYLDPNFLPE